MSMSLMSAMMFSLGSPYPLLDAYKPNTKAAFSISKLFSTATKTFQVTRASDGHTLDIGFVNNICDTASLATFLTATTGTITKWYDQSGNGHDCTFTDAPACIQNVLNGLPATRFNGTTNTGVTPSFLDSSFDKSFTAISLQHKTGSGFQIDTQSSPGYYSGQDLIANQLRHDFQFTFGFQDVIAMNQNSHQLLLDAFTYDGVNAVTYVNKTVYGSMASTANITLSGAMTIGSGQGGGSNWGGDMFCKIFMNAAIAQADMNIIGNKLGFDYAMAQQPFIIFDGNSRTAGTGSSTGGPAYPGFSYPSQLVALLGGPVAFSFLNQAGAGASTETLMANYATSNIYNTNGFAKKNIVVFSEIIDSIIGSNLDTGAQALAAQNTYMATYKALGYTVIVLTCAGGQLNPDPNSNGVTTAYLEAQRLIANAGMPTSVGSIYDYLIDIAASPLVGTLASTNDLTYWTSDKLHNNNTGYAVIAALVEPILAFLLT